MHSSLHGCGRCEILKETAPHLVDSICAYRAGYVAQVCCFCLLLQLDDIVVCYLIHVFPSL